MEVDDALLPLIGAIYDAALDADLWNVVLPQIGAYVGGSGGGLFVHQASRQSGSIVYEFGTEPYYRQLYLEKYMTLDPMFGTHFVLGVGEVFSNSTIMPHDDFLQTRFYKELIRPQGWIDNICVYLDKSTETHATFVLLRHERDGLADGPSRERMKQLVPHLQRAVRIGSIIEFRTAQLAAFAETLDGLGTCLLFVDPTGRIAHANAAGQAMLAEGSVLHASQGRLVASDPQADRHLREVFSSAQSGDAAVGTQGIAVPLVAREGERYVAHVLPLTSGARRRAGANYTAAAALFVQKVALSTQSPPELLAKTYKLTPMELRVLLAIVEVRGRAQVAKLLGVSESTIKTHLGRLYEKTGARRQADLVKLVAGYASPLGD